MNSNKLFGTIHTPPRSYYEPVDTDTIDITINPDRTLKAELTPEVKEAITINRSKLLILEGLLNQTIDDLNQLHIKHIDEVNTLLKTINEGDASLRQQIQGNYDKVNARISHEINSLGLELTSLITDKVRYLENEISILNQNTSAAIADLQDNIDNTKDALNTRIDQVYDLTNTYYAENKAAIESESARASKAEADIQETFNTFYSDDYTPSINTITEAINTEVGNREQAISDEEAARIAADELETNARIEAINNEKAAREQADAKLTSELETEIATRIAADKALQDQIDSKAPTMTGTMQEMEDTKDVIEGTLFVIIDPTDLDNHLTQYVRVVPQDKPEEATWLPIGVTGDVVKYIGCGDRVAMIDSNPSIGGIFIVNDRNPIEEYIYVQKSDGSCAWKRIGSVDVLQEHIDIISSEINEIKNYNLIDPNSLVSIPTDE